MCSVCTAPDHDRRNCPKAAANRAERKHLEVQYADGIERCAFVITGLLLTLPAPLWDEMYHEARSRAVARLPWPRFDTERQPETAPAPVKLAPVLQLVRETPEDLDPSKRNLH